jgi:CheY-like chemotaxis protein
MTDAVAKRIFEPFFTTKPQGVGTGVGLSICHGIVTTHGGRIDLQTAPDRGARFTVVLPAATAGAADEKAAAPAPATVSGRVLVIDDEPDIAALLADRLGRDGFTVSTATSGRRALDLAARQPFDAAVTDLRMPDMDGAVLAEALAARRPGLRGRILVVTGDALAADIDGRLAAAGLPVFEKPLDLDALSSELARRIAAAAGSAT